MFALRTDFDKPDSLGREGRERPGKKEEEMARYKKKKIFINFGTIFSKE